MAYAMIYPEPEKGGRGKKSDANREVSSQFSYRRVQQARSVLTHSLGLAQDVIKGTISLDQALGEVGQSATGER